MCHRARGIVRQMRIHLPLRLCGLRHRLEVLVEQLHRQRRQLDAVDPLDLHRPNLSVVSRPSLGPADNLPQQPQRVDQIVVRERGLHAAVLLQRLAVDAAEVGLTRLRTPTLSACTKLMRPLAKALRLVDGMVGTVAAARNEPLERQPAAPRSALEGVDAVSSALVAIKVGGGQRPSNRLLLLRIPMACGDHQGAAARVLGNAPRPLIGGVALCVALLVSKARPEECVADGGSRDEPRVWDMVRTKVQAEDDGVRSGCALERAVGLVDEPPKILERASCQRRAVAVASTDGLQRDGLHLMATCGGRRLLQLLHALTQLRDLCTGSVNLLPLGRLSTLLVPHRGVLRGRLQLLQLESGSLQLRGDQPAPRLLRADLGFKLLGGAARLSARRDELLDLTAQLLLSLGGGGSVTPARRLLLCAKLRARCSL